MYALYSWGSNLGLLFTLELVTILIKLIAFHLLVIDLLLISFLDVILAEPNVS